MEWGAAMNLSMVQLRPDLGRLLRWAETYHLIGIHDDDLGYALHALLKANFGDLAPKPFALRLPPQRDAELLAYSSEPGESLRERAAAVAEPAAMEAIGLNSLASKVMPIRWQVGARFGFEVRVRPMMRTDKDGNRERSREVDAFLVSPEGSNRGEVYAGWLRQRMAEGGAELDRAHLKAFRLTRVSRRSMAKEDSPRALRHPMGPDATFTGLLAVRDPEAFAGLLARGIGRHRAFGFGMLLLRPA
jgi:CRISPR system Cascade subunit CasE